MLAIVIVMQRNPKCLFVWVMYGVVTKWSTWKKGQSIKVVQHWRETSNKPIWICYISIDKSHNRWWQMKSDYSFEMRERHTKIMVRVCVRVVIEVSWGIELNLLCKNLMLCHQRWIPHLHRCLQSHLFPFHPPGWISMSVCPSPSLQYPFSIHLLIGFVRTLWQAL